MYFGYSQSTVLGIKKYSQDSPQTLVFLGTKHIFSIPHFDTVVFVDKGQFSDIDNTEISLDVRLGKNVFKKALFLAVKKGDEDHIEGVYQIGGFVAELFEYGISFIVVVLGHMVDDAVGQTVDEAVGLGYLVEFSRIPEYNLRLGVVQPLMKNTRLMVDGRHGKGTVG